MRRLLLVLTMLLGVAYATAPLAATQTDLDTEAIARKVLDADPQVLLTGLETPIDDQDLPLAFWNDEFPNPGTATARESTLPQDSLDNALGGVSYRLRYEPISDGPSGVDATAVADDATPAHALASMIFGMSSLDYLVLENAVDKSALERFTETLEETIPAEEWINRSIEDAAIGAADAVIITLVFEQQGLQWNMQMIAVPIGNVVVIGSVILVSELSAAVDMEVLRADAEDLIVAGVEHLGAVAAGS